MGVNRGFYVIFLAATVLFKQTFQEELENLKTVVRKVFGICSFIKQSGSYKVKSLKEVMCEIFQNLDGFSRPEQNPSWIRKYTEVRKYLSFKTLQCWLGEERTWSYKKTIKCKYIV